ncbi:MAG: NADH-quinone oxidoreductase subunit H [Deltaproteobacteria bacterium]|nr:NADH-quinone oxidoreductase subunit H [Deltaproteobacteria bacterium]MBI4223917.1 NADH-quinone oxidoreductase subunit H [Deltaproteobacteria bacterium]
MTDGILAAVKTFAIFFVVINIVPVLIWMERKVAAYIQDRRGPNRAAILGIRLGGMIHSLNDVIKLFTKEDILPPHVNKPMYLAAPMIAMFVATITMAVIPFADPMTIGGKKFLLQIADLDAGLLYVFAVSSLGIYGVLLAGWAANNKFALLGGLRASAQMISYEISLGLAVVGIFLLAGSLKLSDIVAQQGSDLWMWNIIRQPVAFFIFLAALFAETNRLPFDLPEGEAEIVAGYHVEYSSMKFALFFMAEYAHIIVGSCIITTLFFGGWHIPFISADWMRANADLLLKINWAGFALVSILGGGYIAKWFRKGKYGDLRDFEPLVIGVPGILTGVGLLGLFVLFGDQVHLTGLWKGIFIAGLQVSVFLAKALFFCFFFIWVRWTLPRFRYDQLMRLGWKGMLPLALVNILVTGWVVLFGGHHT